MGAQGSSQAPEILHASCVSANGQGVLILGRSGAGKSALALELISRGAQLVADDRTVIHQQDDMLVATCPPALQGKIEARGVGILAAETTPSAPLRVAVDLDTTETERLPPMRQISLSGVALPLLHRADGPHFPAAVLQYLKGGRSA